MDHYPRLAALIGAYFNQDAAYIADSFEGLVADYRRSSHAGDRAALRRDIAAFLADHAGDLDAAFDAAFGFDVDPATWGHDAASFLRSLDEMVRD